VWWTWLACMTDPLAAVGVQPVAEIPAPAPVDVPTTPPMDGAKITGEATVAADEPAPAPAPPPAAFNPVSVPQGPREEGGVQWEGVSKRGGGGTTPRGTGGTIDPEELRLMRN
jgi:hypothetical protein